MLACMIIAFLNVVSLVHLSPPFTLGSDSQDCHSCERLRKEFYLVVTDIQLH